MDRRYNAFSDYLRKKYDDGVEVNSRGNYTKTGLPLADTHYVMKENGKECFTYVYEPDGGAMIFLAQLDEEYAEELQKRHEHVHKSRFPKSKKNWYTVILDDSFSTDDVTDVLDRSFEHVLNYEEEER